MLGQNHPGSNTLHLSNISYSLSRSGTQELHSLWVPKEVLVTGSFNKQYTQMGCGDIDIQGRCLQALLLTLQCAHKLLGLLLKGKF